MNERGAVTIEGYDAVEQVLRRGPVKGQVLLSEPGGKVSLVPWQQAPRINPGGGPNRWNARVFQQNIPVPEHIRKWMMEGLPPEVRRTPRDRKHELVVQLLDDIRRATTTDGVVFLPQSISEQVRHVGWVAGRPELLRAVEKGERWAVEMYAGYLLDKAKWQQKEKDAKRITRDWHGHDNA